MELLKDRLPTIKTEDEEIVSTSWMQTGQERTIEGDGDNKGGTVVDDSYQGSNTGGGDGSTHEQGILTGELLNPSDSNPKGQTPHLEKEAEVGSAIPDAAQMYQMELAEQTKKAEEQEGAVLRERQEEVRKLTQAIQEEMRKQAAIQAAEALKRKQEEEKAAHEKFLTDLKAQLAKLQNPQSQVSTELQQRQSAMQPVNPMQPNRMQGPLNVIPGAPYNLNRQGMQGNQAQVYQWTNPQGTMYSQNVSGPLYVPTRSGQPLTPQKIGHSLALQQSSNRRSPRANVSSLAFDASRKQEQPLLHSTPSSCGGTPTIPEQQSSALFAPIASSSPAKPPAATGTAMLSPKGRKRQAPTVTGQVLDQFLDRKKAKKHTTPNQSPRAKGPSATPMDDLKSQSERKYQLAKSLDVILKENLKQSNFNKIKKQVDEAGFQAIPVPEPFPKDLFCYTISMYMGDIDEIEPDNRAAIVRKNCIDYIVSQMMTFAEVSNSEKFLTALL